MPVVGRDIHGICRMIRKRNKSDRIRWTCERCGFSTLLYADELPVNCVCVMTHGPVPEQPSRTLAEGPGKELTELFAKAGATPDQCKGLCHEWADKMNAWGPDGCREHRQEIIERIKTAMFRTWVTDQIKIGWSISREPWFNPLEPVGCIVDEAIRRASDMIDG